MDDQNNTDPQNSEIHMYLTVHFKDIQPLQDFSDDIQLLRINYSQDYVELMNVFRRVIETNEVSLRVYKLTESVIEENASNYMAWVVRRKCLDELKDLDNYDELEWLNSLMLSNQKNYQIWHHRKLLLDKMNDASEEKEMLSQIFQQEPKNFHAWTHRIWLVRRFNCTEGELDFVERMLKDDIYNNSVWTYRFFLVEFTEGVGKVGRAKIEEEVKYALGKIKQAPDNESPYNYIRGFLKKYSLKFAEFPYIKEELEKLLAQETAKKESSLNLSHALNLLLDINEEENNREKCEEIICKLCGVDFIRKKYYGWRKENLFKLNKEL